jgi:hypothetical protein
VIHNQPTYTYTYTYTETQYDEHCSRTKKKGGYLDATWILVTTISNTAQYSCDEQSDNKNDHLIDDKQAHTVKSHVMRGRGGIEECKRPKLQSDRRAYMPDAI